MPPTPTRLGTGVPPGRNPFRSTFVTGVTFVVGAEAGNAINVGLTFGSGSGGPAPAPGGVHVYLADDVAGQVIAASAPSGGWVIGTNGLLIPIVANKAALVIGNTAGLADLNITEVTAKSFYVCVLLPSGEVKIQKITFV